ncbi:hypothetical protein [Alkalicoccus luteus]|uniref:Uncharacterized protein n=1 Tax=Alkalicoccus luteus TaxID=1237094 RepID=A0A969TV70_9BACI|nr:hypothetical protein [Alkalicoccus luteus]NJP38110.1 hypothetical protein [Alkalicoccus luteus]
MHIQPNELPYYRSLHQFSATTLQTLEALIGRGTVFISHTTDETFTVIAAAGDGSIPLQPGSSMPLEDAY